MANNCYSEFAFYCSFDELEKLKSFHDFIDKNIKLGFIRKWFEKLDIPEQLYLQKTESLKDEILWCSEITETYKDKKPVFFFIVSTESAWCPYPEHFQMMIDQEWPGIKFEVFAEEVDNGLFINTDKDDVFFSAAHYRVYGYYYNMNKDGGDEFEEYFEDKEELAEFLNKEVETDKINKDMSLEEMEKVAEEALDAKFENYSVSIYEFETDISDFTSSPEITVYG